MDSKIIVTGYDREECIAQLTINVTQRELNMLELALHKLWIEQVDNDGRAVNSLNANATYHMYQALGNINKELKNDATD